MGESARAHGGTNSGGGVDWCGGSAWTRREGKLETESSLPRVAGVHFSMACVLCNQRLFTRRDFGWEHICRGDTAGCKAQASVRREHQ